MSVNRPTIDKQIELLCKKLETDSVNLVYTPCNRNITNSRVHNAWKPWQVVVRYIDGKQEILSFNKTAQEAINKAINKKVSKHDYC